MFSVPEIALSRELFKHFVFKVGRRIAPLPRTVFSASSREVLFVPTVSRGKKIKVKKRSQIEIFIGLGMEDG